MNKIAKIAVVAGLIAVTGIVIAMKQKALPSATPTTKVTVPLPRLVDIGSTTCTPCKLMAPILDELKQAYVNVFEVEFIDVKENAAAAEKYAIRLIPTQVFLDAAGKELFRHEGFFSKEEILATWEKLGISTKMGNAPQKPAPQSQRTTVPSGST